MSYIYILLLRWVRHGDFNLHRVAQTIAAFFFVFLLFSPVRAQFNFSSPGPLASPHASIDNANNCNKCHESRKGVSPRLCLGCHQPIKKRIEAKKGYHGRLSKVIEECIRCHPDHAGRDFEMIEWKPSKEKFDHKQTGYVLRGEHSKIKCNNCHRKEFITDLEIRKLIGKKKETYLGLPTDCRSCHFDEHRGQFSQKCQNCHDEDSWKPAPKFNHSKTSFPLKGKHREVDCLDCHQRKVDSEKYAGKLLKPKSLEYVKYKKIPHGSCENCHADVHKGKFGKDCQSCHNENSWLEVGGTKVKSKDFHDKTNFPLRGAHGAVQCKKCHGPWGKQKVKYKGLKFQKCTDCHHDAHSRQISLKQLECSNCHSEKSFSVVTYSIRDHEKTRYPLRGGHRAVPCTLCHYKDKKTARKLPSKITKSLTFQGRKATLSWGRIKFQKDLRRCETCHKDIHQGQFPKKACSSCHVITSFMKLKFKHNVHSRFKLRGKHREVACYECHPTVQKSKKGTKLVLYRPVSLKCVGCHTDVHVGQFLIKGDKYVRCERCHNEQGWKEKNLLFDHNDKKFTDYKIEGKHREVDCEKCHPSVKISEKVSIVRYKPLPRNCFGCHADHHKGEFKDFVP